MTASAAREIAHGTYGGYQQHIKRRTEPCGPCRAASDAYHRSWRRRPPDVHAVHVSTQYARNRALRRLAEIHPVDLAALYTEELERAGLT